MKDVTLASVLVGWQIFISDIESYIESDIESK